MSIDPNIVKNLPDSELIKATQGQGSGVPGWLAASELSSRNSIRQSAPQQAPQSTVIQGVVANALRSSGITGGQQQPQPQAMQPAPPQTQPQGIQGTPARMAKGGPVKLASGGQSDMIPQTSDITYNPVTYNPAVTPDATTLADATAKIAPLYGKGPDFEGTLRNVQGLKAPTPNQGLGNWLTNLVAGAAGDTKGNAVNAFGAGLSNAQQLANQGQQQGFANKLAQQKEALGIQTEEQKRQSDIADATQRYHALNATIADNQAREQAETAKGNSQGVMSAQIAQNRAAEAKAQAAREVATHMANPMEVAYQLADAKAKGDTDKVQLYTDALGSIRGQQQAQSNIEQNREMAVAQAQHSARMNEIMAEQAAQHRYKMEETYGAAGQNGEPSQLAQDLAHYKQDPRMLTRLNYGQKMQVEQQIKQVRDSEGAEPWDAKNYDNIQKLYHEALPSGKIGANVNAANTAISHLDLLQKAGDALQNGDTQGFNKLSNYFSSQTGNPQVTDYNSLKHQVAGELVASLKKNGIPDQFSLQDVADNISSKNSPAQMHGVIEKNMQILAGKVNNTREQAMQTPGISKNDPIFKQIGFSPETNQAFYSRGMDPDRPNEGKVLAGLPGGGGRPTTDAIRKQFIKASNGDTGKAKRLAYDFGFRGDQ